MLRKLRKLDNFDLLVIDDLGYLPQGAEESEVLFTLIAERYERRSLGITSNLVFSEWEKVFANPMATAAAIDKIVHHSVILEFDVPSYRTNVAQNRRTEEESDRQKRLSPHRQECLTWINCFQPPILYFGIMVKHFRMRPERKTCRTPSLTSFPTRSEITSTSSTVL